MSRQRAGLPRGRLGGAAGLPGGRGDLRASGRAHGSLQHGGRELAPVAAPGGGWHAQAAPGAQGPHQQDRGEGFISCLWDTDRFYVGLGATANVTGHTVTKFSCSGRYIFST